MGYLTHLLEGFMLFLHCCTFIPASRTVFGFPLFLPSIDAGAGAGHLICRHDKSLRPVCSQQCDIPIDMSHDIDRRELADGFGEVDGFRTRQECDMVISSLPAAEKVEQLRVGGGAVELEGDARGGAGDLQALCP